MQLQSVTSMMSLKPLKRSSRSSIDPVDQVSTPKLKKPRQRSTRVLVAKRLSKSLSSSSTTPSSSASHPSSSPRYPRRSTAYRGSYVAEFPGVVTPTPANRHSDQVEKILAHHETELGNLFLVKRKGVRSTEATWEPIESLDDCFDLLDSYLGNITAPSSVPVSEYRVEKIVRHRKGRTGLEYEVKWVGYPESDNTWEPRKHLDGCAALEKYLRKIRRK